MTVMNPKALATLLLTLFMMVAAQNLSDGTELLLTDLSSELIVGYGTVDGDKLLLNLSQDTEGFYLYFLLPDGDVSAHQGRALEDRLEVANDAGGYLSLSKVLADKGIDLTVERVSGDLRSQPAQNDDLLEQPDNDSN